MCMHVHVAAQSVMLAAAALLARDVALLTIDFEAKQSPLMSTLALQLPVRAAELWHPLPWYLVCLLMWTL